MKTLTLFLTLSLTGTAAFAQNFSMNSLTPTLTFPKDTSEGDSVTMERISVDK
ncbi:hypothetical protein [uncultured Roseovarius sp.]|uniref:hypothetical protein n=1 Tax=uncultured Roseovarius sp. TaxID=293344 RepID=UPI0026058368|nr:hypothetical protein [uncultured Roseovarius sp.]